MGGDGHDGLADLLADVRAGRPRAVGRAISLVENGSARLPEIMADLAPDTGHAYVVGLTGAPGVGKSSVTDALVTHLRAAGRRVGVLAVDPSSPFSGGAVLGDRVRMQQHGTDAGVYIRSMATRGHLGGLSVAAPHALRVFDAAGLDVVLVETVGVGQSEVEVAQVADVTVVLLAPGMGDAVQAAKAGLLETADLYVVNKADRDGVSALVRDLRAMVALGGPAGWSPPVLTTMALEARGIVELWAAVERFRADQTRSGADQVRRRTRHRREVVSLALARLSDRLLAADPAGVAELADQVSRGELDPYAAADTLLVRLGLG